MEGPLTVCTLELVIEGLLNAHRAALFVDVANNAAGGKCIRSRVFAR